MSDSDSESTISEELLKYEELPVDQRVIVDFERGVPIVIGFCERQQENNAKGLCNFVQEHPEFAPLIQPILERDPEHGTGEIHFKRQGVQVDCIIRIYPPFGEPVYVEAQITLDQFRSFAHLTEPFGCFMTNGGDLALNF